MYCSESLQFRVTSYPVVLGKYDFLRWDRLMNGQILLTNGQAPSEYWEELRSSITKGQFTSRSVIWAVLDVSYTEARMVLTMRWSPWLQMSGIPREVQATIEDLPFQGNDLFNSSMDEVLHSSNRFESNFHSLGLYVPAPKCTQHHNSLSLHSDTGPSSGSNNIPKSH